MLVTTCIGNLGLRHVDTAQSPALGFMQIVPDRTAATLLPILQQHVAQGSVVHSDQWASYNQVSNLQMYLPMEQSITLYIYIYIYTVSPRFSK